MKNILISIIPFVLEKLELMQLYHPSNNYPHHQSDDVDDEHSHFSTTSLVKEGSTTSYRFLIASSFIMIIVKTISTLIIFIISYIIIKRRWTRQVLSAGKCNLPTVMWLPKFLNYHPSDDCQQKQKHQQKQKQKQQKEEEWSSSNHKHRSANYDDDYYCHSTKKMGSSSITNILPRMERLNGPYGMYATVYGISTKVIHIAHPTPARIVLTGDTATSNSNSSSNNSNKNNTKRTNKNHTGVAYSLGAVKNPAYNHFDNLFGKAVFTADGNDWKAKRASVLHCLLKGCTKDDSKESQRLENEANRAADVFINSALSLSSSSSKDTKATSSVNVVKLLQRSTIGLIYRFLTHDEINFSNEDTNIIATKDIHHSEEEEEEDDDDSTSYSTTSISSQSSTFNPSFVIQHLPSTTTTSKRKNMKENMKRNSNNSSSNNNNNNNNNNPLDLLTSYLEAITNIRMIILAQSRSIWFLLPRCIYKLFSPMYKEEEREMKTIREFARCACRNATPGSPLYSLRSRNSHNHEKGEVKVVGVNKKLLDEAITLLFAGQDTSAATLSWTLHLLSLYPKVQQKLAREVSNALCKYDSNNNDENDDGNNKKSKESKYRSIYKKEVIKLPYLDAVLKESMRLYPVAPFVVRSIPDDLKIPSEGANDKETTLPRDSLACIWIYGLHRNKKFWHQPNEFIPERWIDADLQQLDAGQKNGSFMPFAAGPRNCVGQPLAYIVLRIVLAKIMLTCEFHDGRLESLREHCKTEKEIKEATLSLRKDMQAGFTVLPTGGVHLNVKKRKIE